MSHLRRETREPTHEPYSPHGRPHRGMKKFESALLTRFLTGKIGFNSFLYERKVPGTSPTCDWSQEAMTIEHVLLKYDKWHDERRELIVPLKTTDLKRLVTWMQGCRAAVRMVQRTRILEQFKAGKEMEWTEEKEDEEE